MYGVVSVLNVSVSRWSRDVFWNVSVSSRSWGFNVSVPSRSWRYNVSVSGFVTLGLVNIHAMHQACGYIRKKIMDLTCKKQGVKWQTSLVSVFKLRHCSLRTFFGTYRLVSVLRVQHIGLFEKMECLGLVSVLWLNVLWTSLKISLNGKNCEWAQSQYCAYGRDS